MDEAWRRQTYSSGERDTMNQRYDCVIAGGGPAGSIAAMRLAALGWKMLLVDRRRPGEGKACGCCLNARALPLLRCLDLEGIAHDSSSGSFERCRLYAGDRPAIEWPLLSQGLPGLVVSRVRFDAALLAEAQRRGVRVWRHARARLLSRGRLLDQPARVAIQPVKAHNSSTSCGTVVDARLIIGADGLRSGIATAAGLAPSAGDPRSAVGFSCEIHNVPGPASPDSIEMVLDKGGYIGVVRTGEKSVHLGGLVRRATHGERRPVNFIDAVRARIPVLRETLGGRPVPSHVSSLHACGPMPWRPRSIARDRVVLVGDAAGYVEPFTGEGMCWAIENALLLANTIREHGSTWDAEVMEHYVRRWQLMIASRHRICNLVSHLVARPSMVGRLLSRKFMVRLAGRVAAATCAPSRITTV